MGSETEEPVTAEEVPQPVAEEAPKDGESPPMPRPKRLPKPDVSRHKAEVDEMHNKLKERKNNIDAINDKIRQMQSGGHRNAESGLYDRLKALKVDWDAALAKKRGVQSQLKAAEDARKQARNDSRDARSSMSRLAGSGTIDEQITELENRLHHTSMSASEEKRVVDEIGKLSRSKKAAAGVASANANTEKRAEDLRAELKEYDNELNSIKEEQTAIRKKLEDAKSERDRSQASDDVKALKEQITELKGVNDLIWKEIQEKNAQFRADNDAYWEAEQVYRKWAAEDRKRREERDKVEREAKEKEWAAQEAERSGEWYYKEIDRCDQLTNYLSKFQAPSSASTAASNGPSSEVASIDGYKVLKKKDADADDLLGLSSAKRGGKKPKKGTEKAADKPVGAKLTHSLDIINTFGELKIVVPLTTAQVPATMETLRARKQHYLDERAKKVEAGEAPPRESKPSANGTPKAGKPTENGHAASGPSPIKPAKGGKADVNFSSEDMFPSLGGTKGAVEAFPHSAAAMAPAGADASAEVAQEEEPEEAAPPAPEPATITA